MMYWYGGHPSGWGWVLTSVGMVVFWGILITVVVLLVRSPRAAAQPPGEPTVRLTPEQVLAERFARGEIDEADYTGRLATLHRKVPAVSADAG